VSTSQSDLAASLTGLGSSTSDDLLSMALSILNLAWIELIEIISSTKYEN